MCQELILCMSSDQGNSGESEDANSWVKGLARMHGELVLCTSEDSGNVAGLEVVNVTIFSSHFKLRMIAIRVSLYKKITKKNIIFSHL